MELTSASVRDGQAGDAAPIRSAAPRRGWRPPSWFAVLAVLAVVGVVGLVAGCESSRVGAAAVIGDERISVRSLQDDVATVLAGIPEDADARPAEGDVQSAVLTRLIDYRVSRAVAEREKITVGQADLDELLAPFRGDDPAAQQFMIENGYTDESIGEAAYARIVQVRLIQDNGEEAAVKIFQDVSAELGVWVSPRYGAWTGISMEPSSGSLSVPAAG